MTEEEKIRKTDLSDNPFDQTDNNPQVNRTVIEQNRATDSYHDDDGKYQDGLKQDIGVLEREEREAFLNSQSYADKSRLDGNVLFNVIIGIIAVFLSMMIVNGFIFNHTTDQKTAYYLSILASNTLFTILIVTIKFSKSLTLTELGWTKADIRSSITDVFKIWGLTWLIHIAYMFILFSLGITPPENELLRLLQKPTFLILVANIFLIAVAAPIIEETLFRGLLFGSLRTYFGCWTAIILSAAIFSALHFELIGFVPRFALGVGLGYLYVKHKSIYPSMGLHALNNLLAVIMISAYY